jgi:hypothetical protein
MLILLFAAGYAGLIFLMWAWNAFWGIDEIIA